MKQSLLAIALAFALVSPSVYATPETKRVCVTDEKTKKETCKTIKVHKKLDGTKVPEKK